MSSGTKAILEEIKTPSPKKGYKNGNEVNIFDLNSPLKKFNKNQKLFSPQIVFKKAKNEKIVEKLPNITTTPLQLKKVHIKNRVSIGNKNDLLIKLNKMESDNTELKKKQKNIFPEETKIKSHIRKKGNNLSISPVKSKTIKFNTISENCDENSKFKRSFSKSITGDKNSLTDTLIKEKLSLKLNLQEVVENLYQDFYYSENLNPKFKEKMEDFHCVSQKNESQALFCIFDGHGGDFVAKYIRDRIPQLFYEILEANQTNIVKVLKDTFKKIDEELTFPQAQIMGTTATIVFLTIKDGVRHVYSSNVGDSRSILLTNRNNVYRMSYDHKCIDRQEMDRLRKAGGLVINGRLQGNINLSRSLGDLSFRNFGLIPTPYIYHKELSSDDEVIVIASDGVWDVVTDSEMTKIKKKSMNSRQMAEQVVRSALNLGSWDNISCLTIFL